MITSLSWQNRQIEQFLNFEKLFYINLSNNVNVAKTLLVSIIFLFFNFLFLVTIYVLLTNSEPQWKQEGGYAVILLTQN